MNLFEYNYKGTNYQFTLTQKAKIELEKMQRERIKKITSTKDLPKVFEMQKIEEELKKVRAEKKVDEAKVKELEAKLNDVMTELLPLMSEISDTNGAGDEELIECMFILLSSHRDYKGLSRDTFDEIMEDMEYTLGFQEAYKAMVEVYNKVFILIDELNSLKARPKQEN